MNKTLIALIITAIFLASCGKHEFEDIFGPAFEPSSSSSENSSSSIVSIQSSSSVSSSSRVSSSSNISSSSGIPLPSSSSSVQCSDFGSGSFIDSRDGKTYRYVTMCSQTWMAENLSHDVSDSKCYGNAPANCEAYGRLYNWATAMKLPDHCNSSSCAAQVSAKHQGICPAGWYIPSNADWDVLYRYVDGTSGTSSPYNSPTAGRHLKATVDWNRCGASGSSFSCLDTYGFAALPGGYARQDGGFSTGGTSGFWWSASEYDAYIYDVYVRYISYVNDDAGWYDYSKTHFYSVRCLLDNSSSVLPSSPSVSSSSSGTVDKGNDIANYKTVQIGTQIWMAENLNHAVEGSKCYNNSNIKCNAYGRLYDWSAAMALPRSSPNCNIFLSTENPSCKIDTPHRGICPEGWHIPSNTDWDVLMAYIHADNAAPSYVPGSRSDIAGKHLKAKDGWNHRFSVVNEDTYGFAALPGGYSSFPEFFANAGGTSGYWWSASEYNARRAHRLNVDFRNDIAYRNDNSKMELFYSVRCVKYEQSYP